MQGSYQVEAGEYDPVPARIFYPVKEVSTTTRRPETTGYALLITECPVCELAGLTREIWMQDGQQVGSSHIFRIPRLEEYTTNITEEMLMSWRKMVFEIKGISRVSLAQMHLYVVGSKIKDDALPIK